MNKYLFKNIIDLFLSNVKFPILAIDDHWKFNVPISREKVNRSRSPLNNKGAALIFSYLTLTVIFVLTASFALLTVSELLQAKRYRDTATAFWAAEAGINRFMKTPTMLDALGNTPLTIEFGPHLIVMSKDDTDSTKRLVTSAGYVRGHSRTLQIEFPTNPPYVFGNTMSSGSNMTLNGLIAKLEVYGPTRLTGTFTKSGFGASAWFEDKVEGVSSTQTTLKYPDSDGNGTSDQFNDFVEFNRDIVSSYPPEEDVYIQSDSKQVIVPNSALVGKKVIFVEGTTPGAGDVDIVFDATWQDNQNVTVISTGTVNYYFPLDVAADSQLNIIAWDDYEEATILYSAHDGVTYAHDTANFFAVFQYSETEGNLIANNGIVANETLSWKRFDYTNPVRNGLVPPGFQGLISSAPAGYSSTPSVWREI